MYKEFTESFDGNKTFTFVFIKSIYVNMWIYEGNIFRKVVQQVNSTFREFYIKQEYIDRITSGFAFYISWNFLIKLFIYDSSAINFSILICNIPFFITY